MPRLEITPEMMERIRHPPPAPPRVTEAEVLYVLQVDGFEPGLMAGVAYRIKGRFDIERKIIKCPYCGRDLLTVNVKTKVETFQYPKKAVVSCDEFRKCKSCHETTGINLHRRLA